MRARYRTLWDAMKGQRLRYAAAIGLMIAGTQVMYVVPLVGRATLDSVIGDKPLDAPGAVVRLADRLGGQAALRDRLWLPGLIMLVLTSIAGSCGYVRARLVAVASETTGRRLRDLLYDHIQHLPTAYLDKADTGDLVQRCTSDVEKVQGFLGDQIVNIGRAIVMVMTALPIMIFMDARMTLIAMGVVPAVVGFSFVFFLRVKTAWQRVQESEAEMTTQLQENLTGIRVVRAFARQDHESAKFAERNARFRDLRLRLIRLMSVFWPSTDFLTIAQGGLVLMLGAYWISRGRMTVGTVFAFMAYVNMFLWPIRQLGRILADVGQTMVSLGRLETILGVEREEKPGAGPAAPERIEGRIAVRGLTFSHDGGVHALSDVSFEVEPGETLAILGPSGSGKSTIVNLLLRLYDYAVGSIRIDGHELRDFGRKATRAWIGVVMQEPFLYSKTVRDNIRLGGVGAGDEHVEQAARCACVHDSIMAFEKGYETLVGERGVMLSGGQRQRVALARAILKDPPILILDDALSAVDTETETLILDALVSRHRRRTTLVIAHRLSTLKAADRILVLEGGRVSQSGTHEQLMREAGLYRRLWRIQGAMEDVLDGT